MFLPSQNINFSLYFIYSENLFILFVATLQYNYNEFDNDLFPFTQRILDIAVNTVFACNMIISVVQLFTRVICDQAFIRLCTRGTLIESLPIRTTSQSAISTTQKHPETRRASRNFLLQSLLPTYAG